MRKLSVAASISLDGVVQASAFRLEESKTSATGVLITRYVREGEVRTGSFPRA
ncbi:MULTISPECIES: hypothetical protein [Corallococcus]|uniref:hypothetical protein n=1 Tax=Corallococcus TaxID=83461 RepID=UPI0018F37CAF|nr:MULTISPECIES: hypothetical protein [Corallococcus]